MLNVIKWKPLLAARTQLGSGGSKGASGRPLSGLLGAVLKLSGPIQGGLSLLVLSTPAHRLDSLCPAVGLGHQKKQTGIAILRCNLICVGLV